MNTATVPFRPSIAVAAAVLLICLPAPLQEVAAGGRITVADLAAGVAVALAVLRILAGDRIAHRHAWLPFAGAVAAFAIATVIAADPAQSLVGFVRYTELFVLVPVAAAMAVRDRLDLWLVVGAVIATTLIEGGVGVWQRLTGSGASYAGEYIRAVGTFGAEQVLALGAVVGYGIVVTLAAALATRGRMRLALLVTAGLLVLPLAFSLSRGAWIATAFAVLVVLAAYSWRVATAVGTVALFGLLVVASGVTSAPVRIDERLTSIVSSGSAPDRSVRDRYALWGTALGIWAAHPVFGVGLKDFAVYRDSYAPMRLSAGSDVDDQTAGFRRQPLLSPHNQYLLVLAEQGTVGALAFGGLLGTLAAGTVRRRPDSTEATLGSPGLGSSGDRLLDLLAPGVLAWTLLDFAYGDIGSGPTGVLLAVLLGLVARRLVLVPVTERSEVR